MKQYEEFNFGIPYHVIEYDTNDCMCGVPDPRVIEELITAKNTYKYVKVIDKYYGDTNYYMDGMKHNEFGPATVTKTGNEKYAVEDIKYQSGEFKNWKRTKMMDKMLNESD